MSKDPLRDRIVELDATVVRYLAQLEDQQRRWDIERRVMRRLLASGRYILDRFATYLDEIAIIADGPGARTIVATCREFVLDLTMVLDGAKIFDDTQTPEPKQGEMFTVPDIVIRVRCPACQYVWHAGTIVKDAYWAKGVTPASIAAIVYCVKCGHAPPMEVA